MPVTILYQGTPLTFPNLDSPDEAYKQLGDTPSAPAAAGSSDDAPAAFQPKPVDAPQGIDPKLLADNKDWLDASKILYNSTQGHNWDDKKGNEALAEFGLDRMARFNYNLPLMGIDAVALKNAPADQQKAFLYLLDTFDKVNLSWAGAGRFAKYAALDPTNYVGLSTFGIGTLANEGAKLTTAAGVRQALKVGAIGALEGGLVGGAQQRIEQQARVNAGGQEDVDYGQVGKGAAYGAGIGGLLAPLIAVGKNALTHEAEHTAEHVAPTPEPEPTPTTNATQGELPLGDMSSPGEAVQTRLDRVEPGMSENAQQASLPGFAQNELSNPVPFDELPLQRNLDQLPDSLRPMPQTSISEDADRLMAKWDVDHQLDLFPAHPEDKRLPASAGDEAIKLESSKAQGELFDHLPTQTREVIDDAVEHAAQLNADTTAPLSKSGVFDNVPKPSASEKIGGENGPSLMDLKKLLQDVGSTIKDAQVRGWQALTDVSSPLARALLHLSNKDAKDIASRFASSAMTQDEFKGFSRATIDAQNTIKKYIDGLLSDRALATTPEMKDALSQKIVVAEKIMDPLKTLAKEAGTTSGTTLAMHRENLFKGLERDRNLDTVLKDMGLDRLLATDNQKADAIQQWFASMADKQALIDKMDKLVAAKKAIEDAVTPQDMIDRMNAYAEMRDQVKREEFGGLSPAGKLAELRRKYLNDVGSFLAHTVLTPSSLTVNTVSNAMMVFSRPAMDFITKADRDAFRQMTASYGAMARVSMTALAQARLAFETERSILTGTDPKWVERGISQIEKDTGKNSLMKFVGRNGVRIWTRLLNATDEFFQVVSYQGYVEGDATAKAMLAARQQKLDSGATAKLVKDYVQHVVDNAYTKNPDQTTIGMLRDAGIKKGYTGDNLKLYVQNQLDKNESLLRRATNEEGISYTNDLLFKREFSGENAASKMAQGYERFIQQHPEMRIMGQLFFRTPVRVFEAGMRLTPGVQLIVPKFFDDLAGRNGLAREVRARGEIMAAYGATSSVITAYAAGGITGSGYDLTAMERKKLEDSGWRPYSIRVGDKYISYRNFDPVSTPIKIIVNAMERLQKVDYRTAQGELDQKSSLENVLAYVGLGTASILQAVRDANLTSGVDDIVKMFEALADPERKENSFKQFTQSKLQLAVPNAARRGIKFFGDGQNVATDPSTMDQVIESIVNPASDKVTDQFDALGYKRSTQQQGFFPYIGIDAAGREARQRGLSERDASTLNNIAKLTFATGKTFNPSPKIGNIDLKQTMSADGRTTLFNKAMEEFNRNIPKAASDFFEKTGNVASGRRGMAGPKAEAFERLHNQLWRGAVFTVAHDEPAILKALQDQASTKADVFQGNREVAPPIQ